MGEETKSETSKVEVKGNNDDKNKNELVSSCNILWLVQSIF